MGPVAHYFLAIIPSICIATTTTTSTSTSTSSTTTTSSSSIITIPTVVPFLR